MRDPFAKSGSSRQRALTFALVGGLVAFTAGCAQNQTRGEAAAREDAHLAEGLQNFEKRAPMNDTEISNGPGLFSGDEGGFVLFRK